MENFQPGFIGKVFATAWRDVVKSRPLQLISADDIGAIAALSFLDPPKFSSMSVSLAGDELTYKQLEDVSPKNTGAPHPTTFGFIARIILWLSEEMGTMFTFFEKEGYNADIDDLKKMHLGLKNLSTWLESSPNVKKTE
ncbi:hypothetical protein QQX98_011603 [Neonectria punicea]|uniref:NmrA-like domain-containing protein n=1 Tax=Neonectria punicea TaxID=979145 RepID=A0ABR1GL78_9HYPO